MSENKTEVKARIMPAEDGSIKAVVFSAPESPPLLGAKASGAKNAPAEDVTVAESGAEAPLDASTLKTDLAAEDATAAETVDSDRAKAMFAAHTPSANSVFWSKLARSTDPPTARAVVTKNGPALEPVTKVATAVKPAAAGGVTLPSIKEFPDEEPAPAGDADWNVSTKEFPEEKRAPAGISEWTTPSKSRRINERKEASAPIDCSNGYGALLGADGDEGIVGGADTGKAPSKATRGSTPSTTNSGATANAKTNTTTTPKGSVSAIGWLSWPKLCWHNVLCTIFICLTAASGSGLTFAYFSHGSDSLLPSIVVPDATALPTEREPMFAPFNSAPVVPEPPDVIESPAWLIATSGFCSNLNVVMHERDVKGKMTAGDRDGQFVTDISFNYYPQTSIKFTDVPYHMANTIEGDQTEADALVSPAWDHKNIALLEPTSTCSADKQGRSNQSWAISVFKVEEHRACNDGETAWSGHPCVHYTGYVSAQSPNFVNVNTERFVCQLFVDSVDDTVGSSPSKVSMLTAPMMTSEGTCADTSTDTDSEQRIREGLQERIDPKGRTIDQFLRGITSSNEDLLHISAQQFQLGEDIDTGEGLVVTREPTANLFDRNKVAQSLGVSTASSFSSTKMISGDSIAEFSSQFATSASVGGSAWGVTASASASFSSSASGSSKMSYAQLRSTQNVGVVTIHPGGDQKAYNAALANDTRTELEAVDGLPKATAFVKKYGLYFITSATYGGLFTMTKSAETTSATSAVSLSAELSASYGVVSGSVTANDDTSSSDKKSSSKAKVKCYGGDLAKCSIDNYSDWAASVGDQADVVDYTIVPIYKLRDPDNFQHALLKAAFHSLEAKLLGGLQAQWPQADPVASATQIELETVAIKSVNSNRFCRLNRKEGDTPGGADYIITCDGSAKYTGKYLQDRFKNQEKRTSFLAFVFSLVRSERDGEFTLQAWALNKGGGGVGGGSAAASPRHGT